MLKKLISSLMLSLVVVLGIGFGTSTMAASLDTSEVSNGIVKVTYDSPSNAAVAVRVSKGSDQKDFIIQENNSVPLQFGEGEYRILVLESVGGSQFRQVDSKKVVYESKDENGIYLQSINNVNWNTNMEAIKLAKELTKGLNTDKEKVQAIYSYIVSNIEYDYNRAATVQAGYTPSIDQVLSSGAGICYDYSVLFASMLRSLDIPTKVVEGRKNDIDVYHAWNEVYLGETNEWIIIDTTYDADMVGSFGMLVKSAGEYTVERAY